MTVQHSSTRADPQQHLAGHAWFHWSAGSYLQQIAAKGRCSKAKARSAAGEWSLSAAHRKRHSRAAAKVRALAPYPLLSLWPCGKLRCSLCYAPGLSLTGCARILWVGLAEIPKAVSVHGVTNCAWCTGCLLVLAQLCLNIMICQQGRNTAACIGCTTDSRRAGPRAAEQGPAARLRRQQNEEAAGSVEPHQHGGAQVRQGRAQWRCVFHPRHTDPVTNARP